MAIFSGKDGRVYAGGSLLARVTLWTLQRTSAGKSYTANDTGRWPRRTAGARTAAGRLELKLDDAGHAPLTEGDQVLLQLHVDRSGENYYELSAVIESVGGEADISHGTVAGHAVTFAASGPVQAHGILAKADG